MVRWFKEFLCCHIYNDEDIKLLQIQQEMFGDIVLRTFHVEAVYKRCIKCDKKIIITQKIDVSKDYDLDGNPRDDGGRR